MCRNLMRFFCPSVPLPLIYIEKHIIQLTLILFIFSGQFHFLIYFISSRPKNVGLKNPLGTLDRCWQIIQSFIQRRNFNFLQLVMTTWWAREFRRYESCSGNPQTELSLGKPHRHFSGGGNYPTNATLGLTKFQLHLKKWLFYRRLEIVRLFV